MTRSVNVALITNLIGSGVSVIAVIGFGVVAFLRGGTPVLIAYTLTVIVAFVVAFLSNAFVPRGSRWVQLGFWLWPVSLIVIMSLHWYGGGWLFGYLLGLLTATQISAIRHRRTT